MSQRAAGAYVDVEAIRLTTLAAVSRLAAGDEDDEAVAIAKFWAAEAGQRVVHAAQHLHGGVGVDVSYPLHRCFLWAKQLELTLGGATQQLLRIGAGLAGQAGAPDRGRGQGRAMEFNLADPFEGVADAAPVRVALVCGERRLTYAQLDRRANRLAHQLRAMGVEPGQHVGVYQHNWPEFVETMLAAFKVRAEPERLRPLAPGSATPGRLALGGRVPVGYHNDPAKTREAFVELDGVRWAMPGDLAVVNPDATITVLGRGSACINTGGEKVFPEEVGAVLKAHPDAFGAVVGGVPDERRGERVAAVVAPRAGTEPALEDLRAHCAGRLARYKLPRGLVTVSEMVRSPSGKPDYGWARRVAAAGGRDAAST